MIIDQWELSERTALPLNIKIKMTKDRIEEWYKKHNGNAYVSFSGGKDSTVLLHIARSIFPDIKACFFDTGLEFPEIKSFVRSTPNCDFIKPKFSFKEVLEKYGWPVVSKEQAKYIKECQKGTTKYTREKRLYGKNGSRSGMISKKWQYLIGAPFKISEVCCDVMKKRPAKSYKKETGLMPIIGTMAGDSALRKQSYMRYGCNVYDKGKEMCRPMMFWTEDNIWDYIKEFNVPYSFIYALGYEKTGCMFCLFGHHLDLRSGHDRVEIMRKTHPKQYKFCMEHLGMKEVLEWYPEKPERSKMFD